MSMRIHKYLRVEELEPRIAPVLLHDAPGTHTWGSTGGDVAYDMVVDNGGSKFVVGHFNGTVDFRNDPGNPDNHTSAGGWDVFVSSYDASNNYLWTATFGGDVSDIGYGVAVDSAGAIYICGKYASTSIDFDPTDGEDIRTKADAGENIFLTKLISNTAYGWTIAMGAAGGSMHDGAYDVAVTPDNGVVITGYFRGTVDFNPSATVTDNETSKGWWDIFLAKYDSEGDYEWSNAFGHTLDDDVGRGLAVDSAGNIYMTGSFCGLVDFNPDPDVTNNLSSNGDPADAFLAKYDPTGDYVWARQWVGTSGWDEAYGVALDSADRPFITGYENLYTDVFVAAYDSGGVLRWSNNTTTLGGAGYDVAVDIHDDVFLTGQNSLGSAFIAKYANDGTGRSYRWTGGIAAGWGIDSDYDGNIFVAGEFSGTVNFDFFGTDDRTSAGDTDAFLWATDYDLVVVTSTDPVNGAAFQVGPVSFNITFDYWVLEPTLIPVGNVTLWSTNQTGGWSPGLSIPITYIDGPGPDWVLSGTFAIDAGSLPLVDDTYQIRFDGNDVLDFDGTGVDANNDGQSGGIFTSTFYVDNTGPNTGTIHIVDNGPGDGYTNQATPTLQVSCTDATTYGSGVTWMRFADTEANLAAATWVPYSATYNGYDISAGGQGLKTVWVEYRDKAGNIQTTPPPHASDTTIYDTIAPWIINMIPFPDSQSASGTITTITVIFNEVLMDQASLVANSYSIYRSNLDGIFTDTDNKKINPISVQVIGAGDQIQFTFATPLVDDRYRVILKGTGGTPVMDYAGNAIDGAIQPSPIYFPTNGPGDFTAYFIIGEGAQLTLSSSTSDAPWFLDYGFVSVAPPGSGTHTLTFASTGYAPLIIGAVGLVGAGEYDFSEITALIGTPIDPGTSQTANVYFNPTVYTVQADTLQVGTNVGGGAVHDINVTGMGNDGLILNKANPDFTFVDFEGDTIYLKYAGIGAAAVTAVGGGPIGNGKTIESIYFQNATKATQFLIQDLDLTVGDDDIIGGMVRAISGDAFGTFKMINTTGTVSATDIQFDGLTVNQLYIQGAADGVDLTLTGAANLTKGVFKGPLSNSTLNVAADIGTVQIYGNATNVDVNANDVKAFTVSGGNYTGNFVTTGNLLSLTTKGVKNKVTGLIDGGGFTGTLNVGGYLKKMSVSGGDLNTDVIVQGADTKGYGVGSIVLKALKDGFGTLTGGDFNGAIDVQNGSLKTLSVSGGDYNDLAGNVTVAGSLDNLTVKALKDGLGNLAGGNFTAVAVDVGTYLKKLSITGGNFTSDVIAHGVDTALNGIGTVVVKAMANGGGTLFGGDVMGSLTAETGGMKSVSITGGDLFADLFVNGAFGGLTVKTMVEKATGTPIGGAIDGASVLVGNVLLGGELKKVTANDIINGALISAGTIGTVTVVQNLTDSLIHAGGTLDWATHTVWTPGDGNITSVKIGGNMTDSSITAGVWLGDNWLWDNVNQAPAPQDVDTISGGVSVITKVTVEGTMTSASRSCIVARTDVLSVISEGSGIEVTSADLPWSTTGGVPPYAAYNGFLIDVNGDWINSL